MKALLIHNTFLNTQKYSELTVLYLEAARRKGVEADVFGNAEFLAAYGGGEGCAKLTDILKSGSGAPCPRSYNFALFLDKDIRLAGYLESCGIRVFNGSRAIAACDDKSLTYSCLAAKGIPFPKTITAPFTYANVGYTDLKYLDTVIGALGFPMVVKECFGSFGEQVFLAKNRDELASLVTKISPKPHLYQKFAAESAGRDIRINVVGGKVAAAMKRSNPRDFRSNITLGGEAEPYSPMAEEERLAIQACEALAVDFAGVDIIYDNGRPVVCEVNSNCHIKSILDCTGINVADRVIGHIVRISG